METVARVARVRDRQRRTNLNREQTRPRDERTRVGCKDCCGRARFWLADAATPVTQRIPCDCLELAGMGAQNRRCPFGSSEQTSTLGDLAQTNGSSCRGASPDGVSSAAAVCDRRHAGARREFGAHRAPLQYYCNPMERSYRSARMKLARASAVLLFLSNCFYLFGGTTETLVEPGRSDFNPPRFEFAIESAYLLGAINAPASYEIGAEFLTGRIRWGVVDRDTWLRGYNQFYVSGMAEPIFRGIENYYFGFNLGFRYNFVPRGSRFVPYISGGVGGGWIDSHANIH